MNYLNKLINYCFNCYQSCYLELSLFSLLVASDKCHTCIRVIIVNGVGLAIGKVNMLKTRETDSVLYSVQRCWMTNASSQSARIYNSNPITFRPLPNFDLLQSCSKNENPRFSKFSIARNLSLHCNNAERCILRHFSHETGFLQLY